MRVPHEAALEGVRRSLAKGKAPYFCGSFLHKHRLCIAKIALDLGCRVERKGHKFFLRPGN